MKYSTAEDQLTALREKFPPEDICVREENNLKLYYLEWSTVQNRLLDVMGVGGFDIEVGRVFVSKTRVDVECILTLRFMDGSKQRLTGFGSSELLFLKADKELPLEDRRWASESYKAAQSDGFKVAASKVGVGLYLYNKDDRTELEKAVKAAITERETRVAEEKKQATISAITTCMRCKGQITAGDFNGVHYDDPVEFAKATRVKFHERLCSSCVEQM